MSGQPLVSVIVPVYNGATDLPRCIESIRHQTWQNLELLLVNDGSTDTSLQLCRMYEAVDGRIRVIDQPNRGVSAARNAALDAARGELIQFADADDYLIPEATSLLAGRLLAEQADLVIADYYRVQEGEDPVVYGGYIPETGAVSRERFALAMMERPASFYFGVLWNKLYRGSLIREGQLRCDEELAWSEDFLFNLQYARLCRRFCALHTPVYYYCKNERSITATRIHPWNAVKVKTEIFNYYKEFYDSLGLYDENKGKVYRYLVSLAEC